MLERAKEIIADIAAKTDGVILMHSLSGKDSIALLDLLYPNFKRIVCAHMYVVKGLDHIAKYQSWAQRKYPGVQFVQCPHYAWYNYRKNGFMGMEADPTQREWRLSDIVDKVREATGLDWCCMGFKQSDSLNRRLMLRSYKDGKESISWKGRKFYPLSTYLNADVLDYIRANNLKEPESYGEVSQSSGTDITSREYLMYLRQNFPNDLERVNAEFPMTKFLIPGTDTTDKQQ